MRILPLPSIGHSHADRAIRRYGSRFRRIVRYGSDDMQLGRFLDLKRLTPRRGKSYGTSFAPRIEEYSTTMASVDSEQQDFRVWRTITPAALPVMRMGRRTAGAMRVSSIGETKAGHRAVIQALRHAGVPAKPVGQSIRVQREPFDQWRHRQKSLPCPSDLRRVACITWRLRSPKPCAGLSSSGTGAISV